MQVTQAADPLANRVCGVLSDFAEWLDAYGETSRDHQTFFAGPTGHAAKALYYRHKLLGTAAVAPMIFFEAFLPSARRLFHHPTRFPIADAHYAMGFAFMFQVTNDAAHLRRAIHFLEELKKSRSPGFEEYCWGYPYDWVTRNGMIRSHTPLITSTPYVYEAFLQVYEILKSEDRGQRTEDSFERRTLNAEHPTLNSVKERGSHGALRSQRPTSNVQHRPVAPNSNESGSTSNAELCPPSSVLCPLDLRQILESIARHAANDIKDFRSSETASSCSYTPFDEGGVVNAAAYRAFLLTSASQVLSKDEYWPIAERNLNFVLEAQNPDGSLFYAVDGVRDFVDHFHTCFVMKALAKIHSLTGHEATLRALCKGVSYYLANLFAQDGLPKPFSKAPRLTVYKRELYDCAECINLCLLLRGRFPQLETTLETVVTGILKDWIKPDGSFRSRRLHFGWDNVPMHRWGQAQMFRSLAYYLREASKHRGLRSEDGGPKTDDRGRREPKTEDGKPKRERLMID
jgi:hypothetical protein